MAGQSYFLSFILTLILLGVEWLSFGNTRSCSGGGVFLLGFFRPITSCGHSRQVWAREKSSGQQYNVQQRGGLYNRRA